jgi:hypothetical protein
LADGICQGKGEQDGGFIFRAFLLRVLGHEHLGLADGKYEGIGCSGQRLERGLKISVADDKVQVGPRLQLWIEHDLQAKNGGHLTEERSLIASQIKIRRLAVWCQAWKRLQVRVVLPIGPLCYFNGRLGVVTFGFGFTKIERDIGILHFGLGEQPGGRRECIAVVAITRVFRLARRCFGVEQISAYKLAAAAGPFCAFGQLGSDPIGGFQPKGQKTEQANK